ncbi:MAG: peptide chain release factor N(5)-glutamine methyltransferase [Gammaproteobacteria bacterium]|jgi:release factor glutamine methyltransferase
MSDVTIAEILDSSSVQLCKFETARLDCEVLLSCVLNKNREFFYAHPEHQLTAQEKKVFTALISKRSTGYPIAYMTGKKEFWSLQISVNRSTLIPRPETECLVSAALDKISDNRSANILDLGTGSGAIAIALAKEKPLCTIIATDISEDTLFTASKNARLNGLENIHFQQSDWFSTLNKKQFDLILSNPPYVESSDPGFNSGEICHEPRIALDGGQAGLDAYHQIVPAAFKHLNHGGSLILEHAYNQGEAIRDYLRSYDYKNIHTLTDFSGHERVTISSVPV